MENHLMKSAFLERTQGSAFGSCWVRDYHDLFILKPISSLGPPFINTHVSPRSALAMFIFLLLRSQPENVYYNIDATRVEKRSML